MFTSDRDLLVLEPNLFRDAGWVGQRLLTTTASVSAATITLVSGSFTAAGIAAGHVLIYDTIPLEVVGVLSGTTATVSLVRAGLADAPIPPPALGVKNVACWSFRPQASLVHTQVLRMLGIDPDAPPDGPVSEACIVNPASLALAESLGTLHLIYTAAAALAQADSALAARAAMYRQRFCDERQHAVARIDLDGDGQADATRRLNALQLLRA